MKIVVYTLPDCPHSKAEKEYLTSHNFQYEEKDVKQNREFITEMLALSDNFAGVPFTVITKDDGTEAKLKGFTQSEFDEVLMATPATPAGDMGMSAVPADPMGMPSTPSAPVADPSTGGTPTTPATPSMPVMPAVPVDSMSTPSAPAIPVPEAPAPAIPSLEPTSDAVVQSMNQSQNMPTPSLDSVQSDIDNALNSMPPSAPATPPSPTMPSVDPLVQNSVGDDSPVSNVPPASAPTATPDLKIPDFSSGK